MTPWVRVLLGANIAAYFLQQTSEWVTSTFWFYPPLLFSRPWTLVTYMFLHGDLMHIGFNMLGLYFFGVRVEDRLGRNRFLGLYFVSGIVGALFSFITPNTPIVGASAGLYGVMLAFAYYWPETQILVMGVVPMTAKVMVIMYTLMALWFGYTGGGNIAHFAHLGGFVGGGVFLKLFAERGRKSFRARAEGADKLKTARWKAGDRPNVDMSKVHDLNKEEVNRILDKISAHGVGSLTPQEKTFLSNFVPMDDRGIKS